jgi:hypothetical protein
MGARPQNRNRCQGATIRGDGPTEVWCHHWVEPDRRRWPERYGAETTVPDWHARLVCSMCGSRRTDMFVMGTEWRWERLAAV